MATWAACVTSPLSPPLTQLSANNQGIEVEKIFCQNSTITSHTFSKHRDENFGLNSRETLKWVATCWKITSYNNPIMENLHKKSTFFFEFYMLSWYMILTPTPSLSVESLTDEGNFWTTPGSRVSVSEPVNLWKILDCRLTFKNSLSPSWSSALNHCQQKCRPGIK